MFLLAVFGVVELFGITLAGFAYQHKVVAGGIGAVFVVAGFASAVNTNTDSFGIRGEIHAHAAIENIELALPQPVIAIRLAVLYDATVYLVDIFKAALFHHGA